MRRWRASTVVVWLKKFSARCASTQCSGSVHVASWVFSLRAVCWQPHPAGKFQALSIIKNVRHAGHADTLPSEFGLFYWVAILITSDDPLLKLDEFEREVDICSLHKFLVCAVSLWITCEKIVYNLKYWAGGFNVLADLCILSSFPRASQVLGWIL